MRNSVYISGPISGRPYEEVKREFSNAYEMLCERGYKPVNPLNNGVAVNAPWEVHMAADIDLLAGCGKIYLLPGWERSQGAKLEVALAKRWGIEVVEG